MHAYIHGYYGGHTVRGLIPTGIAILTVMHG